MGFGILEKLRLLYVKKNLSKDNEFVMEQFSDNVLSIRLGDLISEISWLSGVDKDKINVTLDTDASFEDLYDLEVNEVLDSRGKINSENTSRIVRLRLWNDQLISNENEYNNVSFNYLMFMELDFNTIQADGKKLIKHSSIIKKNSLNGKSYYDFRIDKNIEDVICCFNSECLDYCDGLSWHPADLFSQAVSNCIQRQYGVKTAKTRKRVK